MFAQSQLYDKRKKKKFSEKLLKQMLTDIKCGHERKKGNLRPENESELVLFYVTKQRNMKKDQQKIDSVNKI